MLVLHGGGETGSPQVTPANTTNITANRSAIVWATRREQAYVVAPQLPGRLSQWTEPAIQANVMALIDRLAKTYPIDRDRIYLTGLSRGARGAIEFLANNPRTFAGALLAAARAENDDVSEVAKFARVPIWFTHAADDPVVPYQGSVDLANALEAAGTRVVRGEWAGDNSAGPAQDRAAETAARRLRQSGPRRLVVHDLHAGLRRRRPPLRVGADVRDGCDARLASLLEGDADLGLGAAHRERERGASAPSFDV